MPIGPGIAGGIRSSLNQAVEEEPGILMGALQTLGRPGYIARDLLAGDFSGAAGQAAVLASQVGSAPFTGGVSLVDPNVSLLGLTGYLGLTPKPYELATREASLEASDLAERYDVLPDWAQEGAGRIAFDIVGGMLTDPLSLVSGGAGGLGRESLSGLSKAGSLRLLKRSVGSTSAGRAALAAGKAAGRSADDVVEGLIGPGILGKFDQISRAAVTGRIDDLLKQGVVSPFTFKVGIGRGRFAKELSMPTGRLSAPLAGAIETLVNPFNRHFLTSSLGGAVAGPAGTLAARAAVKLLPGFDDYLKRLGSDFVGKYLDRFVGAGVPKPVSETARGIIGDWKNAAAEAERQAVALFEGVTPSMQNKLRGLVEETHDGLQVAREGVERAEADLARHGSGLSSTATQAQWLAQAVPPAAPINPEVWEAAIARHAAAVKEAEGEVARLNALKRNAAENDIPPFPRGKWEGQGQLPGGAPDPRSVTDPLRHQARGALRAAGFKFGQYGLGGGVRPAGPIPNAANTMVAHFAGLEAQARDALRQLLEDAPAPLAQAAARGADRAAREAAIAATKMPTEAETFNSMVARAVSDPELGPLGDQKIRDFYAWYLGLMRKIRADKVEAGKWADLPDSVVPVGAKIRHAKLGDLTVQERLMDGRYMATDAAGNVQPVELIATRKTPVRMKGGRLSGGRVKAGNFSITQLADPQRIDEMYYAPRRMQPWVEEALGDEAKAMRAGYKQARNVKSLPDLEAKIAAKLVAAGKGHLVTSPLAVEHGLTVGSLPAIALSRFRRHTEDMAALQLSRYATQLGEHEEFLVELGKQIRPSKGPLANAFAQGTRRWKGLLTTVNPAFHTRNWTGTVAQALSTPGIAPAQAFRSWLQVGLEALPASMAYVLREVGGYKLGIKALTKLHAPDGKIGKLVRAAYGDPQLWEDAAKVTFKGHDGNPITKTVAGIKTPFTGQDAIFYANGRLLRQSQSEREVIEDLLGKQLSYQTGLTRGEDVNRLYKAADFLSVPGQAASNFIEDRMRMAAFANLLENGDLPREAVAKVNKAFVDYEVQSVSDYWLRQAVPFSRFTIATVPAALKGLRDVPLLRTGTRAVMAEAARGPDVAPEKARRGFAVPLGGGSYLQGLGLPIENVDELLRALPGHSGDTVTGVRRALANLHPVASGAIGAATNTNLYFGDEFFRSRNMPGPAGDVLEAAGFAKRDPKTGEVRADPKTSAVLGQIPFARQVGYARELSKSLETGDLGQFLLNYMTGFKVRDAASGDELADLAKVYFERRAREGDLGVYRRFFRHGTVDQELERLLKAADTLKDKNKKRRAREKRQQ